MRAGVDWRRAPGDLGRQVGSPPTAGTGPVSRSVPDHVAAVPAWQRDQRAGAGAHRQAGVTGYATVAGMATLPRGLSPAVRLVLLGVGFTLGGIGVFLLD